MAGTLDGNPIGTNSGSTDPTLDASTDTNQTSVPMETTLVCDPYIINPNDSPNSVFCNPPLTGDNYASWARGMLTALSVKGKMGFIDGSLLKPTDPVKFMAWKRADDLVTSWLYMSLSPTIKNSILYCKTALQIWTDLKVMYDQSSAPKLFQLKQQISTIRQDNDDVMTYYTRIRALWDEIDAIRPFQTCICGYGKDALHHFEQDRSMEFLQGLHERFSLLRSSILQRDEFPPIATIYQSVRQEEVQQAINAVAAPTIEAATLATSCNDSDGSSQKKKKRNFYCDYCHKGGHTKDRCYQLYGYPSSSSKRKDGTALASSEQQHNGTAVAAPPPSAPNQQQGVPDNRQALSPAPPLFPGLSDDHLARLAAFAATLPAPDNPPAMHLAGPINEEGYWSG